MDQHRAGLQWTDNPNGMYFFRVAMYNVSTTLHFLHIASILGNSTPGDSIVSSVAKHHRHSIAAVWMSRTGCRPARPYDE